MENIIQGKTIAFVGSQWYEDRDILAAYWLGARYVAKGIGPSGWEGFERLHKGVVFDLFIDCKQDPVPYEIDEGNFVNPAPDTSNIDPEILDGLQRRFPEVQVISLEVLEVLEGSVPKPSFSAIFEQLAAQSGFCLHLQLPFTAVLDFGHFTVPDCRFDAETEPEAWRAVVLGQLNGFSAMEVMRGTAPERLPIQDEDLEECHLPGLEQPFWHYQSTYSYPILIYPFWTYPLAQSRNEIYFDSILEMVNPEIGSVFGCLCTASVFDASKVRLHWRAWVDPATNGIEGIWVLERPPLSRSWKAKEYMNSDLRLVGIEYPRFPESVQPIFGYFEKGAPLTTVKLLGTCKSSNPISEDTFRNQVVYLTDVKGCAYPLTFVLMAFGAKTVQDKLSDQATIVVGLENEPASEFGNLPYYSIAELDAFVFANHGDLLQTLKALMENGYQLRNPSDEGWLGPDLFQGGEILSPADLPKALLDYVHSSPFVANWMANANSSGRSAKPGFEEIVIGARKAYLRWEDDPYDYYMNLQRGDAVDTRLDNMELDNHYFGAYWTYRVMAYLNADPSFESVNGLFIVGGMDNKDSTFQVVAVPRTWT